MTGAQVVLPVAPAAAGPQVTTDEGWAGHGTPALPSSLSSVLSPFTPADGGRNRLAAAETRCPFPSVSGLSPSPRSAGRERGARLFVFLSSCNRPTFNVASGYLPR